MEEKIVKFMVWDLEIDEIVEMEMNEEDYKAMVAAEEEYDRKQEEARKRRREEEWDAIRFSRHD